MSDPSPLSPVYQAWIAAYELRMAEPVRGESNEADRIRVGVTAMCYSATEAMVEAFPELRRVRGYYGNYPHWWCIAPDGAIVDPTAAQFRGKGLLYEEYQGPDPIGRCMECGELVWGDVGWGGNACSADCGRSLEMAYGL